MPLGQDLRTARLNRRLTLSQVAERTHVKFKILDAIENEDFSTMPAAIYAKGFIRLYAECVGLDPHQLIDEYVTRFGHSSSAAHKLEKEMFTIDRNGIVTRRDAALADMVAEDAPAEIPTVQPVATTPEPLPTTESVPTPESVITPVPEPVAETAPIFQLVAEEPGSPRVEPVPAPAPEEVPLQKNRVIQADLFDRPAPTTTPLPVESSRPVEPQPVELPIEEKTVTPVPIVEKKTEPEYVAPKMEPEPAKPAPTRSTSHESESSTQRRATEPTHSTSKKGPASSRQTTQQRTAPVGAPPSPSFSFKGIFIILITATLLVLCLVGLARLFSRDDAQPATPATPEKSPTLRLAVDPPKPYFH